LLIFCCIDKEIHYNCCLKPWKPSLPFIAFE
jgi:hypothetical protein